MRLGLSVVCFVSCILVALGGNVTDLAPGVPVYMMMPLTTVLNNGFVRDPGQLNGRLQTLKNGGVYGIMIDVWWGIVERKGPKNYDFGAYLHIVGMCKEIGLKMAMVGSFHQCGGNVGDDCSIPLPRWVLDIGNSNANIFYTDKHGYRNNEYLSLGVDREPLFHGRSPLQMYGDFMQELRVQFAPYLGNTLTTLEVGLGPAGEMRYPSYPLAHGKWEFPGVGEFQCYDSFMRKSLSEAAIRYGKPAFGGPPSNSGSYKENPDHVPFYTNGHDNYRSEYGVFFLRWYSNALIDHARAILKSAADNFRGTGVQIAAKIAGIHWHYYTEAHGPELTAGYYHTRFYNGYDDIAKMMAENNIEFQFTCLEMRNSDQRGCGCGPEELVRLTRDSAWRFNIKYSGENALPTATTSGYSTIVSQSKHNGKKIASFTYLRMFDWIFDQGNFNTFKAFVRQMTSL
jgi:beta-amylase